MRRRFRKRWVLLALLVGAALWALWPRARGDGQMGERCRDHDDCAPKLTCERRCPEQPYPYCSRSCYFGYDDCGEGWICWGDPHIDPHEGWCCIDIWNGE